MKLTDEQVRIISASMLGRLGYIGARVDYAKFYKPKGHKYIIKSLKGESKKTKELLDSIQSAGTITLEYGTL